jgi:subtilase family serine protease
MLYTTKLTRTLALAALTLFFAAAPSRAENYARLVANHPDAAADLAAEGTAPAYQPLNMEIYLKPRNQAQLEELSQEQQDPNSPQYHRFLSPTEYDQRFGSTDADVAQITQWLTREGFTVTFASAHERRVAFSGDVATAQTAFSVQIAGSSDGKSFGNVEDPQVPESLAPTISYLAGLDNLHGTTWNELIPDPPFNNQSGDGPTVPFFGPTDIRTFNDETPLINAGMNGAGQCIAVSEGSDVDQASLGEFNTIFSLPAFVIGTNYFSVFPDGSPGAPGSQGGGQPYGEAMLDVEYAHGIAPGASIVLYAANAGTSASAPVQALVDTVNAIVNDKTHNCLSVAISWAQCGEPTSFYTNLDMIFQQGAMEGKSIFVATGDLGTAAPKLGSCVVPPEPATANIEENAGSPHVTAVGASMFQPTYDDNGNVTSTLADTMQTVWNFSRKSPKIPFLAAAGASTGGYSKIFLKPTWQNGVAGIAGKFRAVPDLVLGGGNLGGKATITIKGNKIIITGKISPSPNFWECFDEGLIGGNGQVEGYECATTGGTSIVPPQYAGILAIINQKTGAANGQGLINQQLYAMAQANLKKATAVGLIDIVSGNNAYAPVPGYAAHKGFDLASGWGSVDINKFVNSFISFVPPPPKTK